MAEVGFADLVEMYRHIRFADDGGGVLHVANEEVARTLRSIEADEALYDLTQISMVVPANIAVGDDVPVNVAAPSHKLGYLSRDFDALFSAPGAAFGEPANYYVIDPGYAPGDEPIPPILLRYRALLTVIAAFREAATYVSDLQRELVFIKDEKVVVPISFHAGQLPATVVEQAERLRRVFTGPLHGDEKTGLLADAIIELARGQRQADRFAFLIANIDRLCDEVEKGYRLFVSSFSYSKIRKEIETARLDYVGKIHKTIVDIQGQLLGIPIATIVVASQLKRSTACGVEFWTNAGVLLGAWIFVSLLWIAVRNQWHTLVTLDAEINGQRDRLSDDYEAVRDDFIGMFDDLIRRIAWHRTVLIIVSALALAGAVLATVAFLMLTQQGGASCLAPR